MLWIAWTAAFAAARRRHAERVRVGHYPSRVSRNRLLEVPGTMRVLLNSLFHYGNRLLRRSGLKATLGSTRIAS